MGASPVTPLPRSLGAGFDPAPRAVPHAEKVTYSGTIDSNCSESCRTKRRSRAASVERGSPRRRASERSRAGHAMFPSGCSQEYSSCGPTLSELGVGPLQFLHQREHVLPGVGVAVPERRQPSSVALEEGHHARRRRMRARRAGQVDLPGAEQPRLGDLLERHLQQHREHRRNRAAQLPGRFQVRPRLREVGVGPLPRGGHRYAIFLSSSLFQPRGSVRAPDSIFFHSAGLSRTTTEG